jgi:hypothetical protein
VITLLTVVLSSGAPSLIALNLNEQSGISRIKRLGVIHTGVVASVFAATVFANEWVPYVIPSGSIHGHWSVLAISVLPLGAYGFLAAWSNAVGKYYVSTSAVVVYLLGRLILTYILLSSLGVVSIVYGYAIGSSLAVLLFVLLLRRDLVQIFKSHVFPSSLRQKKDVAGFVLFGLSMSAALGLDIYIASRNILTDVEFGEFATFVTLAKVPLYVVIATLGFVWPEMNARTGIERSRLIFLCLGFAIAISVAWWLILLHGYLLIAELLLSRSVDFESEFMNGYFAFILLMSCMVFVWNYMNVVMDRFFTMISLVLLLISSFVLSSQNLMGTDGMDGIISTLLISVGLSLTGAICLIIFGAKHAKL